MAAIAFGLPADHAAADYTVTVKGKDAALTQWEGWGTSLCWWANEFGDRADIADLLFTLNGSVSLTNGASNLPALGFNIARYNIGGSGSNVVNDNGKSVSMKASKDMPAFKTIQSFWLNWFNSDPASSSWNWAVDAKQRTMLQAAKRRGANLLEAFSNSPPWWMTNNYATAGADKKGTIDNLQSWNHEQFAVYLATVVKYAKDNWGITFNYVEPFNEPMAEWWVYPKAQEGCHFTLATQNSVLKYLRTHLDQRGLQSIAISASDENNPQQAYNTLKTLSSSADVIKSFQKVNTHGYDGLKPYRGTYRGPLKTLAQQNGKKLWDSEYGEDDASGLSLAESIGLDINDMGVSAFVYWQALDSGAWGLIQSNPGDVWIGGPNPKYYVLAQYSRHIRPGMKIISSGGDKKTVVAYDASRKVLVIVTVNTDTIPLTISYDLSSYTSVAGPIKVWKTETSGTGDLYRSSTLDDKYRSNKYFESVFTAKSVQTFEIQGVVL
ncbi:Equilibrative nucleoside transporter, partial [Globisporangium splendens]